MIDPRQVSAVIPARNEEATIGGVIRMLRSEQPALKEIVVVDDGSSDRTAAVAAAAGAMVIRHADGRGYGAAVKSGILAAKGDYVLTLDADGQHRGVDVDRVIVAGDQKELVAGHRIHWHHSRAWRLPGKWLLTAFCRYLVRQPIPDLNCGLRLYRRATIVRYLPLCSDAYSFTASSLVVLLYWHHDVGFVPVEVQPASSQGRVTVRTGLDVFMFVLRMATLLDPLRVFLPLSMAVAAIGLVWGAPYALAGRGVSVGALLLLLTGMLLFAIGLLSDQIAQLRQERIQQR